MNSFQKVQAEPFKPHQCLHWSDGRRCRQYAMHNEYFCVRHRIDPIVNIVPSEPFDLAPFLTDRAQIQAALGEVLTRLAAKTIDDKRARLLLYTLQNAISNLKNPNRRMPHTLDASPLRRRRRRVFRWQPQQLEPPDADLRTDAVIPSGPPSPEQPPSVPAAPLLGARGTSDSSGPPRIANDPCPIPPAPRDEWDRADRVESEDYH